MPLHFYFVFFGRSVQLTHNRTDTYIESIVFIYTNSELKHYPLQVFNFFAYNMLLENNHIAVNLCKNIYHILQLKIKHSETYQIFQTQSSSSPSKAKLLVCISLASTMQFSKPSPRARRTLSFWYPADDGDGGDDGLLVMVGRRTSGGEDDEPLVVVDMSQWWWWDLWTDGLK